MGVRLPSVLLLEVFCVLRWRVLDPVLDPVLFSLDSKLAVLESLGLSRLVGTRLAVRRCRPVAATRMYLGH